MAVLNKHTNTNDPSDAVYIGPGSKWANPFGMLGESTRDLVCSKHEAYLQQQFNDDEITLEELASLHGKDLVCFCAPKRCHGHTLEKWALWAFLQLQAEAEPYNASELQTFYAPANIYGTNIIVRFEAVSDNIVCSTTASIKRIEHQDDGSIEVVIDHWPT